MKSLLTALLASLLCTACLDLVPNCDNPLGEVFDECAPATDQDIGGPGGKLYPAFEIARRVENIRVVEDCLSACVVIALAGEHRVACTGVWFGVHRATSEHGQRDMEEWFKADPRVAGEWLAVMSSTTPNHSMYYFSAQTAEYIGLVDEIVNC